ncbi:hypothetical protein Dda_4588 [Drechslerella dactyloides]|uniref:Uncharacterized protein n=1 Tax=Drechslerella dactyloides TaxID=74499 RepID=A0AAD6NJE4_DREDA|nr:hypothetical protein Dda_4588 [Drechslerella dactyloides]
MVFVSPHHAKPIATQATTRDFTYPEFNTHPTYHAAPAIFRRYTRLHRLWAALATRWTLLDDEERDQKPRLPFTRAHRDTAPITRLRRRAGTVMPLPTVNKGRGGIINGLPLLLQSLYLLASSRSLGASVALATLLDTTRSRSIAMPRPAGKEPNSGSR